MKNLLILIVAIAVFLHFYPQPEVTEFYEEQKAMVLSKFSEATDTKVRLKTDKVSNDIEAEFATFRKSEKKYATEITQTRQTIQTYYQNFCQKNKRDFKFQKDNQIKVCKVMQKYAKYM